MSAERDLKELLGSITSGKGKEYVSSILVQVQKITGNGSMRRMGMKLGSVNGLFQSLRRAFKVPDKENLSEKMPDDNLIHEKCNLPINHMDVFIHVGAPDYISRSAKIIIDRYKKREVMLFANNPEHTIPRTNNGMERFSRIRGLVRTPASSSLLSV